MSCPFCFCCCHSLCHGLCLHPVVRGGSKELYLRHCPFHRTWYTFDGKWGMVSQESSDFRLEAREILVLQYSTATCLQLHPVVPSFPPTTIRRVGSNTTATTLRCLATPCFFLLPRLLPFLPPPPIPCPPLPNPINCQPLFSIPEKFGPKLPTKTHALRSSWRLWVSPFLKEAAF